MEDMPRYAPAAWPPARKDLRENCEKYRKLALDLRCSGCKGYIYRRYSFRYPRPYVDA